MKLLIAGAGGHGRVVADAAAATGLWSHIAFIDDRCEVMQTSAAWPIVGRLGDMEKLLPRYSDFVAAFGDAQLRLDSLHRAHAAGFKIPVLIHPRSVVSQDVSLGMGTVVFAGAVLNIGSVLGVGCIVNTGATVDHDCRLDDGVHICPGAHLAGSVKIGAKTWFGIGAIAKQGICIGSNVTVGAGAVCVRDIRDGVLALGVPARESKVRQG